MNSGCEALLFGCNLKLDDNLFSQMAGSGWWIDNFVIENGKVECQSQPNRMSWLHFRFGYIKCFLISFLRILNYTFRFVQFNLEFGILIVCNRNARHTMERWACTRTRLFTNVISKLFFFWFFACSFVCLCAFKYSRTIEMKKKYWKKKERKEREQIYMSWVLRRTCVDVCVFVFICVLVIFKKTKQEKI